MTRTVLLDETQINAPHSGYRACEHARCTGRLSIQCGDLPEEEWKRRFAGAKKAAKSALAAHDTVTVLAVVLSRIYTLRNQLIHGGATWNGSVNREQMRDCGNLMGKLVPVVIETMMDNPTTLWGDACYPVVK